MNVILNRVKTIFDEIDLKSNITPLRDNLPLTEQGIDSLDMFACFLKIEENFNIKIPDNDTDRLKTINDIVDYINTKTP